VKQSWQDAGFLPLRTSQRTQTHIIHQIRNKQQQQQQKNPSFTAPFRMKLQGRDAGTLRNDRVEPFGDETPSVTDVGYKSGCVDTA